MHVSCLDMFRYVCHVPLYFMSPTFWYRWHQCIHITLTALESFLLHQEFNHCTLANKRHWQPHFLHHTAETLIKRHMHQCALMCVTELWLWLCFGCRYGQLGIGFNWFLDRKVIWTGNKKWWGTHGRGREGKFCWCWMWAWGRCTDNRNYHSVQVYTFRRCKISLWKMLAPYNLPGFCTVWPQLSPACKTKSTEYKYSVIHWLMSYLAFTMLADL